MKINPVKDYLVQYRNKKLIPHLKRRIKLSIVEGKILMNSRVETANAKKIIKEIVYITLATASRNGLPWITPLFSAYDKDYNFYWISSSISVHSVNITHNRNVAIIIYDSRAPEGKGFGVYIRAKASVVETKSEIKKACRLIYRRKNKPIPSADNFTGDAPRKIYKAVPQAVFINDIKVKEGEFKHVRLEVQLK